MSNSRIGTCRWSHQIQEMWTIPGSLLGMMDPDDVPPHLRGKMPKKTREIMPESYTCEWLSQHSVLPPPIRRLNGGFQIRGDDCDTCPLYEPPVAPGWTK